MLADEFADIKARLDAIKAERVTAVQGEPDKEPDVYSFSGQIASDVWTTVNTSGYHAPDDFMGFDYPHAR